MERIRKLAVPLLFALETISLIFILFLAHSLENDNSHLKQSYSEAELELGRAKIRLGNAEEIKSDLRKRLRTAIEARNEAIEASGRVKYVYVTGARIQASGAVVHTVHTSGLCEQSEDGVQGIGKLSFKFADKRLDSTCTIDGETLKGDLDYNLHLKFESNLVQTVNPEGEKNYYLEVYDTTDGRTPVKLDSFTMTVTDKRKEHLMFVPHLEVAGLLSVDNTFMIGKGLSVSVSAAGYGLTKNDLIWRFGAVSIDMNDSIGLGFTPVEYNIGTLIPIVSNVWIGPHIGIRLDTKYQAGVTVGAVF